MSNLVNMDHARIKAKAKKYSQGVVDGIMELDFAEFETSSLSLVLEHTNTVIQYYIGEGGAMTKSSPEQLIQSAKNQTYSVASRPEIGSFKIDFDEEIKYALLLNSDVTSEQQGQFARMLSTENRNNLILKHQHPSFKIFKSLDTDSNPKDWLPKPYQTSALINAIRQTNVSNYKTPDAKPLSEPANINELISLAQFNLFNIILDPETNSATLLFNDKNSSVFSLELNKPANSYTHSITAMYDNVANEVADNHAYSREHNPEIARIKANMACANAMFFEIMDSQDEPKKKNDIQKPVEDKNNVISFKMR
jgi:hypothetical protein